MKTPVAREGSEPQDRNTSGNEQSIIAVALQYCVYTLLVFAAIVTIWKLAEIYGARLFSEDSVLEWVQFGVMVIGAVVTFGASYKYRQFAVLLRILGMLCALAMIREMDKDLDRLIPVGGWQLPFLLTLIGGIVTCWKNRGNFARQLRVFFAHRSFGMMWAGFMVAIPFGQMIGHGPFLLDLFGEDYVRPVKRLIEECAEMIGYLMILFANLDFVLSLRARGAGR